MEGRFLLSLLVHCPIYSKLNIFVIVPALGTFCNPLLSSDPHISRSKKHKSCNFVFNGNYFVVAIPSILCRESSVR